MRKYLGGRLVERGWRLGLGELGGAGFLKGFRERSFDEGREVTLTAYEVAV